MESTMTLTQKKRKKNSQDDNFKFKSQPIQMESEFKDGGRVEEVERIILKIEN